MTNCYIRETGSLPIVMDVSKTLIARNLFVKQFKYFRTLRNQPPWGQAKTVGTLKFEQSKEQERLISQEKNIQYNDLLKFAISTSRPT